LKQDTLGVSQAEDGLAACTAFAADLRFDHPMRGRRKAYDSMELALRSAIQRTRAGERVRISDEKTVEPVRDARQIPAGNYLNNQINNWRDNYMPKESVEELQRIAANDPGSRRSAIAKAELEKRGAKDAERDVNSTTSAEGGVTIKGIHFSSEEVKKYPRKVLEKSAKTGREPWSLYGKAKDATPEGRELRGRIREIKAQISGSAGIDLKRSDPARYAALEKELTERLDQASDVQPVGDAYAPAVGDRVNRAIIEEIRGNSLFLDDGTRIAKANVVPLKKTGTWATIGAPPRAQDVQPVGDDTAVKDSAGNKCEVSHFGSLEKAQQALKSLKNCTNCMNCRDCTNCTNCIRCANCTNCYDCYSCRDCTKCTNCYNCTHCANCRNCRDCTKCTNCHNCRDCTNCEYCSDCKDLDTTRSYSYNKPTRSAAKDVQPVGDEFHVVVKGGSIGSSGPHVTSTHATREEAAEKAKRMNKLLSPGEKKYYGLGYSVKEQGK
jgi:hypothetical protein